MPNIRQPLGGNFNLMPDVRVFAGKNLYLIKPMQLRFWLALADADAIAMDLEDAALVLEPRRSHGRWCWAIRDPGPPVPIP
jgi:hypothetical protein